MVVCLVVWLPAPHQRFLGVTCTWTNLYLAYVQCARTRRNGVSLVGAPRNPSSRWQAHRNWLNPLLLGEYSQGVAPQPRISWGYSSEGWNGSTSGADCSGRATREYSKNALPYVAAFSTCSPLWIPPLKTSIGSPAPPAISSSSPVTFPVTYTELGWWNSF